MTLLSATLITLLFTGQLIDAYAVSSATSHIGMTKLGTLQVSFMDTDELYADQMDSDLLINTCLLTSGEPMPYRISASSLHGKTGFAMINDYRQSQIGYEIVWSGASGHARLRGSADVSDVILTGEGAGCDSHTLAIDLDDQALESAAMVTHTDTLSLIFVIE